MQIHIYVPPIFWQELYDATDKWPAGHRGQADICRYAMGELVAESYQNDSVMPNAASPTGTMHVQCRVATPDEVGDWKVLAEKYGSGAAALRVAIQFLYDSIVGEEEDIVDESPWVEFDKLDEDELLAQSTDVLRRYASHLGVLSPSKITGGKSVLVSRILAARGVQSARRDDGVAQLVQRGWWRG